MRTVATLVVLAALAGASFAAPPQRVANAPPTTTTLDIQSVIAAQIAAFKSNDGARALAFATSALRAKFEDGPHFIEMVRTAYPTVFRAASYSFTGLLQHYGVTLQKVEIVGPAGERALAIYQMAREHDGSWHIAGCTLTASEQIDL